MLCVLLASAAVGAGAENVPANQQPAIPQPAIPQRVFKITDYGAVGDGKTLNTASMNKAVDACAASGGGTVLISPGRFLTGPFKLASNLNLQIEAGATLLFSDNPADYQLKSNRFENCLVADECHDISITGQGTIDGQGEFWWKHYVRPKTAPESEPQPAHRPYMVVLKSCRRVLVRDVTLTNSPSFHLVPELCRDVVITGIHIQSPPKAANTDGLDPSGWNFLISHCTFDDGDDCIAVKPSGSIEAGQPSCKDLTIEDCTFLHGHGLSIGGQTPGGLRHMIVRNCTFKDTQAGIRLKAGRGAGGLVEDLSYQNLTMDGVKVPIYITSYYPKEPAKPDDDHTQPVNEKTPIWRNIHISNLTVEHSPTAGKIFGLPEMPISDIVMTNVKISAEKGMQIVNAKGIRFVDSHITVTSGAPLILHHADVEGLQASASAVPEDSFGLSPSPGTQGEGRGEGELELHGPWCSKSPLPYSPRVHGEGEALISHVAWVYPPTIFTSAELVGMDTHPTSCQTAGPRKITVATDGTGDFKTIQEAIASLPDNPGHQTIIHLKPGTYSGQIVVPPTKSNIKFEGDNAATTIITFNLNQNEPQPPSVDAHYKGVGVAIAGDGFTAENITFQNTSGDHGQAIALRIDGDRAIVRNCRILGWQDTLMVNNGRQYFDHCYIEGRVDFIYGSGTAVFDQCEIHSKNGGYVTAANTPADHPYGLVFFHCKLTGDAIAWNPATTNPAATMPSKHPSKMAYLGRPWRPYAAVAFIQCELGDHIRPVGWNNWGKTSNEQTARYAEYASTGPGANPAARAAWSKQLTTQQAQAFTIRTILAGSDAWDPTKQSD